VKCRFNSCPDYSVDPKIFELNKNTCFNFIEEEKNNFEKKKEEKQNKKIYNRNFDFEKS